jgi:Zn-dependent peptidase ImmA (M78 family)
MVRDKSGRFPLCPRWEIYELEQKCEETILSSMRQRYGFEPIRVPTEAVTELIEDLGADLDVERSLSNEQYEVFGYTEFERGKRPLVVISRELWLRRYRSNRLRMTLAHELAHVLFHRWLYDRYPVKGGPQLCYWQNLLPATGVVDWMEWQAGYGGGALLMPESYIRRMVATFFRRRRERPPVRKGEHAALTLAERVASIFDVSLEAATVRLTKLKIICD